MNDEYTLPPLSELRRMLREQVRILLKLTNRSDADAGYLSLVRQTMRMMALAKKLYPAPELDLFVPCNINNFVPDNGNYGTVIAELNTTLTCLANYIDVKNGNPTAHHLIGDTLHKARTILDDDHQICAVVLSRIALEQGLKTLCDLKNVDYSDNDMAGQINDKLWKADIYEKHVWREIQSKLDFLNAPLHGGKEPSHTEVERMISWIDTFLDKLLKGDMMAISEGEGRLDIEKRFK